MATTTAKRGPKRKAPEPEPEKAPVSDDAAAAIAKLAQQAQANETPVVEADDDDPAGDDVEFVRTGVIRLCVGGGRYRLRRPFMGELRTLRLALEDMEDEVDRLRAENQADLDRVRSELESIDGQGRSADRDAEARRLTREVSRLRLRLDDGIEDAYVAWWAQAFKLLAVEPDATVTVDTAPPWLVNHQLLMRVLGHWRSVPLARGPQGLNGTAR